MTGLMYVVFKLLKFSPWFYPEIEAEVALPQERKGMRTKKIAEIEMTYIDKENTDVNKL